MAMENLNIRELAEKQFSSWDNFVEESSNGSIFSSSLWLKVLNKAHDGKAEILGVFNGNELVSGILLFVRKKGMFKVAAYPPLTPFTSVLFKEPDTKRISKIESQQKVIMNSLLEYLIKRYNYTSISMDPSIADIRPFLWRGWEPNINYTYEVNLANTDELWNNLDKDVKYEINKGKKLELNISNNKDISEFYGLYEKTFSKQNMNVPIKEEFIKSMVEILQKENKCKTYFATTKKNELAASAIAIYDNKKAYYLLAASNHEIKAGAPSFLLWHIFKDLSKKFKKMDLVGANTPQIVNFKRQFATRLVPYYSIENYNSLILKYLIKIYKKLRL
jgi:lipid II:glycine glycyltransferase (peptidoglycan interpeptide bridge formation enzyme)